MVKINIIFILFLQLFIWTCTGKNPEIDTKYSKIVTKYTEIKQIASTEVDDTFYVFIRLPKYYHESERSYPVLYLLDGDISFNMATSVVRYLQFGKDIPDLIIVAPAYGTMLNDSETNFRERDYTISQIERFKGSGGAENYLRFIKNELIPQIDKDYRTNSQRILNGYSLGALFAINTLLESPQLFDSYIAGSPFMEYDIDLLNEKLINLDKFLNKKKLFISVGELEDKKRYRFPINKLFNKLDGINNLEAKFILFNNGTHFTSPSEALIFGLKYIFEDNSYTEQ